MTLSPDEHGNWPDFDDLPDETRAMFEQTSPLTGGREGYEAFLQQQQDLTFDQPPRVAHTPDVIEIMHRAASFPSPDGHGLNRQLSEATGGQLDPEGVHVLRPVMIHRHAGGAEVEAHMRCQAYLKLVGSEEPAHAHMDVPMEAFLALPAINEYRRMVGLPPVEGGYDWRKFIDQFWRYVDTQSGPGPIDGSGREGLLGAKR